MKLAAMLAVGVALAVSFVGVPAEAALTSSEKGQLRDFVVSARIDNADRVRTLVARTDHTESDSIAALVEALSPVPWSDARAAFMKEVVFGGASAASRPLLATATVRALLARADTLYQKHASGLDREPKAVAELGAIYAFLDAEIANAGKPTAQAHDPAAGIPPASYEAASKALRDHVEQNQRWLKGDGSVPEAVGRVRAQAQVLVLDMLPDGLTRRVDAADRLGLRGSRRRMLTEWGVLFADAGKHDDATVERIRQLLAKLPGARVDLSVVYAGADRAGLRARGAVAFVGAPGADAYPFGDDVAPGAYDASTAAIGLDLAVLAARRALDNRGELRLQSERDAVAAQGDPGKILGRPRGPGVDHVIGAAIHLLLTDAPRAVEVAVARWLSGRRESAALLSDAIGALAAYASPPPADKAGQGPQVELGKPGGAVVAGAIRLAPNGTALGFTLDGHAWALDRASPSFAVTGVRRDNQIATLAHVPSARLPLEEKSRWAEAGYVFTKMRGTPRAALAPAEKGAGVNVKMMGVAGRGYDAIGTSPPGDDVVVEGELTVRGGPAGIAVRAGIERDGVRGALLVVTPNGRTTLVTSDDVGNEALLGAPIDPSPATPVRVRIAVTGTKIEATVGAATIQGTLPATLAKGDIALVAKRGATVEVAGLVVKKK